MNSELGRAPFNSLEKSDDFGGYFDVHKLENNPNFLVKKFKETDSLDEEETAEIAQEIQTYIAASSKTSLLSHMSKGQAVIGESTPGVRTVYVISEKIEGEKISLEKDKFVLSPEQLSELNEVMIEMIDTYVETFNGQFGLVPEFCGLHNYLDGVNLNRPEGKKLYFFDNFPIFKKDRRGIYDMIQIMFRRSNINPSYRDAWLKHLDQKLAEKRHRERATA